jgi:hypothetical protein
LEASVSAAAKPATSEKAIDSEEPGDRNVSSCCEHDIFPLVEDALMAGTGSGVVFLPFSRCLQLAILVGREPIFPETWLVRIRE